MVVRFEIKCFFSQSDLGSVHKSRDGGGGVDFFKRHESVTRRGLEIFSIPQRAIFTFFNSEFCIFPTNLIALAQNFQKPDLLYCSGNYPEFWSYFLSDIRTYLSEIALKLSDNFYLIYMGTNEIMKLDPVQKRNETIDKNQQIYIGQQIFWFVGRKK